MLHVCLFVCLFVCLGGRQGEADELNCNPLQRVGIPFFRDLASHPWTLLLPIPPRWYWGGKEVHTYVLIYLLVHILFLTRVGSMGSSKKLGQSPMSSQQILVLISEIILGRSVLDVFPVPLHKESTCNVRHGHRMSILDKFQTLHLGLGRPQWP